MEMVYVLDVVAMKDELKDLKSTPNMSTTILITSIQLA